MAGVLHLFRRRSQPGRCEVGVVEREGRALRAEAMNAGRDLRRVNERGSRSAPKAEVDAGLEVGRLLVLVLIGGIWCFVGQACTCLRSLAGPSI